MENLSDSFKVKLPARITGIVFWGLVFIGLLISVFILEDAENDLYMMNKTNSHMVAYALEGIVKKNPQTPALESAEARIKLTLNQLRDEMGFTSVVLSENETEYMYGERGRSDDAFPYSISYYPKGSQYLQTISALIYFPNQKLAVASIRMNMLLTIGISVFIFGVILQQILHRVLSGPFTRMVHTAREFSNGNDSVRFNESFPKPRIYIFI